MFIASFKTIFYAISGSFFFMSFIIECCYGATNEQFRNCSRLYNCGDIRDIGYPFWGDGNGDGRQSYCGSQAFRLECLAEPKITMWSTNYINYYYIVLRIDPSISKMTMARSPDWNGRCPNKYYTDTALPSFSVNKDRFVRMIKIFYGCSSEIMSKVQIPSHVTCEWENGESGVLFAVDSVPRVEGCNFSLSVPISLTAYNDLWDGKITLAAALELPFDVQYGLDEPNSCSACEGSGGKCGSNSTNQFICICPDQSYLTRCPNRGNGQLKAIIGATAAGVVVVSACLIISYYKFKKPSNGFIFKRKGKDGQNLDALIEQYGFLTPKRYRYSDIKKITSSFRDKLGSGGYGDVYKGNLFDGSPVAVKILNASKGEGEDFVNEVASISRTSHVNVVTLLGFCLEGQKRALVYEFMPNGSLEKFIHAKAMQMTICQLAWKTLHQIALGVARGLEYLHRGCSTRILHFDIKPHNILLDEDFRPKISDFGLAKLCTRKESIISMLVARGTIGYIAPEVISRNFGCVSHKSDVYSYGMMILEMAGGRKNVSAEVSHTSEIYFPHWVYHHLVVGEDLKLKGVESQEANEIARKMIVVGLWCIQTDPLHRPPMDKVIEMLEGSLQALEIPPKPFFGSPSRSTPDCSNTVELS